MNRSALNRVRCSQSAEVSTTDLFIRVVLRRASVIESGALRPILRPNEIARISDLRDRPPGQPRYESGRTYGVSSPAKLTQYRSHACPEIVDFYLGRPYAGLRTATDEFFRSFCHGPSERPILTMCARIST